VSDAVLDSSAVLALLYDEPGSDIVIAQLPNACLSAVNFAEIISKLCDAGAPSAQASAAVRALGLEIVDFDPAQAVATGALRPTTRALGLSLGDRACLALAAARQLPAVTADRAWTAVPSVWPEVTIVPIR